MEVGNPEPSAGGGAEPDPTEAFDERLTKGLEPDFHIVRLLGRGSMASVYLAREPALRRLVAIKVLSPMFAWNDTARARFLSEGRLAASLTHPNIVPIHRVGSVDGEIPFLVMQFVDGKTLRQRLRAEGRFEVQDVFRVLEDVASALAAAHERGVVHRDVRPGNVLCDKATGRAILTDFGIAVVTDAPEESAPRLTPIGQLVGDLAHMSPERLADKELTGETDIYSLGVLAYELLTGEGPYGDLSTVQLTTAHLKAEPRALADLRPDAGSELSALLARCLSKTPEDRPRAADIVRLLSRVAGAPAPRAASYPDPAQGAADRGIPAAAIGGPAGPTSGYVAEPAVPTKGEVAAEGLALVGPPEGALQLRTLGTVELLAADGRSLFSVLAQPKRVALLSFLATGRGSGFKRRDTMLGVFWPDHDQERARHALRQTVYVLRRSLGPNIIVSRGDDELGLDSDRIWCDVAAFEAALEADNPTAALELYNGELLPGFYLADEPEFERWLDTERDRLRRRASEAAWSLVDELEHAGESTGASYWARRAVSLSPYDEQALCRFVELLERLGDRGGAVRAYDRFARRLQTEYETEPSPATRALIARVRSGG